MSGKFQRPPAQRVLIVDDEPDLLELLELTIIKMGIDVDSALTLERAHELLQSRSYSLCLTDMRLPDGDGIDLVRFAAAHFPDLPIAVLTAFGSADSAVAALKAGAFDYLSKPVALDQLRATIASALRVHDEQSRPGAAGDGGGSRLIGQSPAIARLRQMVGRLACSMAPVAIHGESGSGKEVVARSIHESSPRAQKAFVAVNCGAIPETLMEAEFFGYRKGAFTGADSDREGFFQAAQGGTLLLDEVGELPLLMQVKLLRAIQERRIRRLGGGAEEAVDVRIISATHRNLAARVAEGLFRSDLFYRLNVLELDVPPLRERKEDLDELVLAILARLSERERTPPKQLALGAMAVLRTYDFPGNVRELENILERASALCLGTVIELHDMALPKHGGQGATTPPLIWHDMAEWGGAAKISAPVIASPNRWPGSAPDAGLNSAEPARGNPTAESASRFAATPAPQPIPGMAGAAAGNAVANPSMDAAGRFAPTMAAHPVSAPDNRAAHLAANVANRPPAGVPANGFANPAAGFTATPELRPAIDSAANPIAGGESSFNRAYEHPHRESADARKVTFPLSLPEHLENIERDIIGQALAQTGFNRTAAARLLGLTFRQLRYRMQQLDIGDPS